MRIAEAVSRPIDLNICSVSDFSFGVTLAWTRAFFMGGFLVYIFYCMLFAYVRQGVLPKFYILIGY